MDGRRRFLRSLGEGRDTFAPAAFGARTQITRRLEPARPRPRRPRAGAGARLAAALARPGAGFVLVAAVLAATGVYGAVRGGHYQAMVDEYGQPADIVARALGFGIDAVRVVGRSELTEPEILAAAGIGPRNSLPFLDAARVRERLLAMPLVKDVSVAKLYPDRLLVEIEERKPGALWQKDGTVNIVATDGRVIDRARDRRFAALPLVVGEGANEHIAEYRAILEAAGPVAGRVRAGVYISGRRWNLKTDDGIDVLLPEADPVAAAALLARLQSESHVLDKAVVSIDLRQQGRLVARLSEDAAAERAALEAARKPKAKGSQI
ncbi:cell division protein FtsQ/DivIB [Methylocella sp.]|uniref:cell division protein FtsQ/DivIB n=1 Tax=Methylocella sp. TaxID=1978226 RepID=UPI0037844A61